MKQLTFENYRCHEKLEMNLKPLTVLLGENNTGKSAVLEAVRFLRDASRHNVETLTPGMIAGGNRPLGFNDRQDVLLKSEFDLTKHDRESMKDAMMEPSSIGITVSLKGLRLVGHSITLNGDPAIQTDKDNLVAVLNIYGGVPTPIRYSGRWDPGQILAWTLREESFAQPEGWEIFRAFKVPRDILHGKLDRIFFKSPYRFPGKLTLEPRDLKGSDIQDDGQQTSGRLHALFSDKDERFQEIEKAITQLDGELTGITSPWLGGRNTTIRLGTALGRYDIDAMGDGLKKASPIIVQLIIAPHDSVVLIEEPELHLHPTAVRTLVEFFVKMTWAGKQVIITTHSGNIVQLLWSMIQEDESLADSVALWVFRKDKEGNRSQEEQKILGVRLEDLLNEIGMLYP